MKITKAVRIKDGNSLTGIDESGATIHVTVYDQKSSIGVCRSYFSRFDLYEEDAYNYEPVSIYSFNRMLRLAQYRINKSLSNEE